MWLIILSNQLWIVDLVGRYPTNYLIQRGPIQRRNSFPRRAYTVLAVVSNCCSVPLGMFPRVTHPSAAKSEDFARLACVRPTASVRSEPGSNSQVETSEDVSLTRKTPHIVFLHVIEPRPSVDDTCASFLVDLVDQNRPHISSFHQRFQRASFRRSNRRRRVCGSPPPVSGYLGVFDFRRNTFFADFFGEEAIF